MKKISDSGGQRALSIGFFINPVAGAGGPLALKGSDNVALRQGLYTGRVEGRSQGRARQFLKPLVGHKQLFKWICPPGVMGAACLQALELDFSTLSCDIKTKTDKKDTQKVVCALLKENIDLLVFVGGDGTARDVCEVVGELQPCLGIPSGVKMQSSVFGVHPLASAQLVIDLALGKLTGVKAQEVRDIDEHFLQKGLVKSRHFGFLNVPESSELVQNVKQGALETDEQILLDIAAEIRQAIDDAKKPVLMIFGPGSTTASVQRDLGFEGTLLGVDARTPEGQAFLDLDANALDALVAQYANQCRLVLTVIGGQGHLIGRGNQQLTVKSLKAIGRENCWVVASKNKLQSLNGRPLIMDSGDAELDQQWAGLIEVICAYNNRVLYRVGHADC